MSFLLVVIILLLISENQLKSFQNLSRAIPISHQKTVGKKKKIRWEHEANGVTMRQIKDRTPLYITTHECNQKLVMIFWLPCYVTAQTCTVVLKRSVFSTFCSVRFFWPMAAVSFGEYYKDYEMNILTIDFWKNLSASYLSSPVFHQLLSCPVREYHSLTCRLHSPVSSYWESSVSSIRIYKLELYSQLVGLYGWLR